MDGVVCRISSWCPLVLRSVYDSPESYGEGGEGFPLAHLRGETLLSHCPLRQGTRPGNAAPKPHRSMAEPRSGVSTALRSMPEKK